jgi:hypothetical protein
MLVETVITFVCATVFLVVQCVSFLWARGPVRRFASAVALASGVAFCLLRWLIQFVTGGLAEPLDFCVAVLLAGAAAAGVSFYRSPRKRGTGVAGVAS